MEDEYKKFIKEMSAKDLNKEMKELENELMRSNLERSKGSSPYHKGGFQVKILKWKKVQIIVEKALRDK